MFIPLTLNSFSRPHLFLAALREIKANNEKVKLQVIQCGKIDHACIEFQLDAEGSAKSFFFCIVARIKTMHPTIRRLVMQ